MANTDPAARQGPWKAVLGTSAQAFAQAVTAVFCWYIDIRHGVQVPEMIQASIGVILSTPLTFAAVWYAPHG